MKTTFTIKEVAKSTGLSAHTLRFYEKQNLIKNVSRDENGYRIYSDYNIQWIHFLIKAKNTGMSLNDLQTYSELMERGDSTIPEREKMLLAHRKKVVDKMKELNGTLDKIDEKLEMYQKQRKKS